MLFILLFSLLASAETNLDSQDQKALKNLESEVSPIKQKVYETKTKVHELEEAVLRGKITGSKALISFENEAEGFFAFSTGEFYLDDQLIKKINSKEGKDPIKSVDIFDSDIPSGDHKLRAKIIYRGSDKSLYTAFPYFKDHEFVIDTTEKFEAEYGKTTVVKLVSLDKGYFKSNINERLFLKISTVKDWGTEPIE